MRSLEVDGETLGWEYDKESYLDHPNPQFSVRSAFAQTMHQIAYRDKVSITNCLECGNTMLNGNDG